MSGKERKGKNIIGAKYFPHPKARPGQKQFMVDVSLALRRGTHLVAHAPTGIGKTVAVLTPAATWCKVKDKKLLFLTSRLSQHHMAVETLKRIREGLPSLSAVDIVGKKKMCPIFERSDRRPLCESGERYGTCPYRSKRAPEVVERIESGVLHVDEAIKVAEAVGICPYKASMESAANADVVVCDYNYVFSSIRDIFFRRMDLEPENTVLIVDEAHNLPDRIRRNHTSVLSPELVKRAAGQCSGPGARGRLRYHILDLGEVLTMMDDELFHSPLPAREVNKVKLTRKALIHRLNDLFSRSLSSDGSHTFHDLLAELRSVLTKKRSGLETGQLGKLYAFLKRWDAEGPILRLFKRRGTKLEIYPLDPSEYSFEIFDRCYSAVLMSGTLFPGEMYARVLGLEEERTTVKNYSSPFPPENRLVVGTDAVTSLYRKRDKDMYRDIAGELRKVAGYTSGNVAVFFPSYKLLGQVYVGLDPSPKKVLTEKRGMTKKQKRSMVERLKVLKEGKGALMLAVLGGSLAEGVDYSGNLLSGICIVGFPLQPPTAKVKERTAFYKKKFGSGRGYYYSYIFPTVNRVLQASGRAFRSYSDRAFILLMDHRFGKKMYRKAFPADFGYEMLSDPHGVIREFIRYGSETGKT